MVALQKHRAAPAGFDGRRRDGAGILQRPLLRVVDFRTGDLKNQRPHFPLEGGPKNGLGGVEGNAAQVDRRNGKAADVLAAHRLVQRLNRRGPDAQRRRAAPNQPGCGFLGGLIRAEHDRVNQIVDELTLKFGFVQNADVAVIESQDVCASFLHLILVFVNHGCSFYACNYCDRYCPAIATSVAEPM